MTLPMFTYHIVLSLPLALILWHCQKASALSLVSSTNCPKDQSFALLGLKNSFSFAKDASLDCRGSYPKMVSWKNGTDCCSWEGIICDPISGQVIEVDLSCSWIQGPIPSNSSLFHLQSLQRLNLAFNYFNHTKMPSKFGWLTGLTHLNLSTTYLSGPVASEISYLSKLISLDLSLNDELILEAPDFSRLVHNLTDLVELYLDFIDMSTIAPSSLVNLSSSIQSLSLGLCQLRGNFPEKLFHLPNLQLLSLSVNSELQGSLPRSNWSSPLMFLQLGGTKFSGELPDSIGNLKSLMILDFYGCNFRGSIPASLGNLHQLTELSLAENNMTGVIPDVFGNIGNLFRLAFTNNSFTGQLPSSIFSLRKLSRFDPSQNKLEGGLPEEICTLSNLTYLDLSYNSFSGKIPSCLFSLPTLSTLHLNNNKLAGELGEFKSKSLTDITMNDNMIQGRIPPSIFGLRSLTILSLQSNNLSGTVELEKFSVFTNLSILDISFNSLSVITDVSGNSSLPMFYSLGLSACNISELPDFLRTQNRLTVLSMSHNRIHGQIPEWLSTSVVKNSLKSLVLSHNFLTRVNRFPPTLESVDLSSNMLQQPFPVPPQSMYIFLISNNKLFGELPPTICNITNLMILDVSNNSLTGTIPECLEILSNQLSVLNLGRNSFHGKFPGRFGEEAILRNFDMNGNQFEGPLPTSLVNCKMLEVLDIGNNFVNDTFPTWLETLPKLEVLVLRSNRFHGPIGSPKTNASFSSLRIIDLSHNDFSGILPETYFKNFQGMVTVDDSNSAPEYMGDVYYMDSVALTMKGMELQLERILTIFTTIDMSSNRFEGQIPEVVGELRSLVMLNFSHNSLTGHIPSSLANLAKLESLDLSSNQLTGSIPQQLSGLNFLSKLNVSYNQLLGMIPKGGQFDTFPTNSFEGNLGLCGFPLPEECGMTPQAPPSVPIETEDSESLFDWKFALMGYGCGLVIGLSVGYIVFTTGKPWWLVRMVEKQQQKLSRKLDKGRRRKTN
ncbi:hypothetical protein K2173_006777 [Erythroxylum novogranatense]|uniref:Leucine-rich repeat-containing N-terminal plant-type domain-containing protein n=1 Tax=Erythroxylum novogranatense TaxID=1862640 RepID=A0AAV8SXW8_9ROSI|nr:hypothetical protein K2173_006777 [Erythroxylum novogranatense]